jgi:hypothetical protein
MGKLTELTDDIELLGEYIEHISTLKEQWNEAVYDHEDACMRLSACKDEITCVSAPSLDDLKEALRKAEEIETQIDSQEVLVDSLEFIT